MTGRGRHTTRTPRLTYHDEVLLRLLRQTPGYDQRVRQRAAMILLAGQGVTLTAVARRFSVSRRYVYKWLARWQEAGLLGLEDQRCGRPAKEEKSHAGCRH